MKIAMISLFPEMFEAIEQYGVSGRAIRSGIVNLAHFNPRDFADGSNRCVDDRPYGGGPGMVIMVEPLLGALAAARDWMKTSIHRVVHMSPQGNLLKQKSLQRFLDLEGLILIAGRYEGVDERFVNLEVDEEWSIGDYVLSGGELAAMVLTDALTRHLPNALGHAQSAEQGSFSRGLLGYPQYTRPDTVSGVKVPEVLLSGDHDRVRLWRMSQSLQRTRDRRPELLCELSLDDEQSELLSLIERSSSDNV